MNSADATAIAADEDLQNERLRLLLQQDDIDRRDRDLQRSRDLLAKQRAPIGLRLDEISAELRGRAAARAAGAVLTEAESQKKDA